MSEVTILSLSIVGAVVFVSLAQGIFGLIMNQDNIKAVDRALDKLSTSIKSIFKSEEKSLRDYKSIQKRISSVNKKSEGAYEALERKIEAIVQVGLDPEKADEYRAVLSSQHGEKEKFEKEVDDYARQRGIGF